MFDKFIKIENYKNDKSSSKRTLYINFNNIASFIYSEGKVNYLTIYNKNPTGQFIQGVDYYELSGDQADKVYKELITINTPSINIPTVWGAEVRDTTYKTYATESTGYKVIDMSKINKKEI